MIRCPLACARKGRGLWRLIAPLTFALASAPVAFWRILRRRPDVVLCIEPTLLGAPRALWPPALGARTALHVQDLEVDAAFAVGHLPGGGLIAWLAHAFERRCSSSSTAVVTISHAMAKALGGKGSRAPTRVQIVRNWVEYLGSDRSQGRTATGANSLSPRTIPSCSTREIGAKQASTGYSTPPNG